MLPDTSSDIMNKENYNSPTRLLAATLAFKLLKRFGQGTTQRNMQELFNIRPKQLALCITGRKYLDGTDRWARKQRASGEEPSTSSQQQLVTSLKYYLLHSHLQQTEVRQVSGG